MPTSTSSLSAPAWPPLLAVVRGERNFLSTRGGHRGERESLTWVCAGSCRSISGRPPRFSSWTPCPGSSSRFRSCTLKGTLNRGPCSGQFLAQPESQAEPALLVASRERMCRVDNTKVLLRKTTPGVCGGVAANEAVWCPDTCTPSHGPSTRRGKCPGLGARGVWSRGGSSRRGTHIPVAPGAHFPKVVKDAASR